MAVLVLTEQEKFVFNNVKEFCKYSKEIVRKYGKIKEIITNYSPKTPAGSCPECGSSLVFEEGCKKCHSCGYSACG
ncbi:hypothetical protein [Deferribacter abyssi]|uniref:hypothetical protein n=1 Tax=Deferribacter abyssi TaxID=213806 RepID=UPI003C16E279